MSFPVSDISQAYRSAPERTEDVWQKVKGHVSLSRVREQEGGEAAAHIPNPEPSHSIISRSSGAW